MPLFNWPYTNLHSLNLDWIIRTVLELEKVYDELPESLQIFVNKWLAEHPEATTTVQDGSLTEPKFSDMLKLKAIKDYVTPQMFGAKGDGENDDTEALEEALNSGKNVFIPIGKYLVSRSININRDRVRVIGEMVLTKTGASDSDCSLIIASNAFNGDYILKFNGHLYNGQILNEAIQLYNFVIDCNDATGGIYAPVLYDNCFFESLSILNVAFEYYGFDSPTFDDSLTQTVVMDSVWITGQRGNSREGSSVPLMHLVRWQECTFNNVKLIGTNVDCVLLEGCWHLLFSMCSTGQRKYDNEVFSTGGSGAGYKMRPYINNGYGINHNIHISFDNCLNEGCAKPFDIYDRVQILTGTFSNYTNIRIGDVINQGNVTAYAISATQTTLYVQITEGSEAFAPGTCSAGTITRVNNYYPSGGIKANNHRTIGISEVVYHIHGASDTLIEVGKSGSSTTQKLNAANNLCTAFKYPYSPTETALFDFENSELDGTVDIESSEPYCVDAVQGETVVLPPATRGLHVKVRNAKTTGVSVQPYSGNNVDGYTSLAYYGEVIEFVALNRTRWHLIKGIGVIPINVVSGGTISNNASARTDTTATLSFKLTASAATFNINVEVVPRENIYFMAYNETQNKMFMCYMLDTGVMAPYESGQMVSGDVIFINTAYNINYVYA